MPTKIAILGWGSLLWDRRPEFDQQCDNWLLDGPVLKLEFSRISESRLGALTLVIDPVQGAPCRVAYAPSKRTDPEDAICDLRWREGTTREKIGYVYVDGSREPQARDTASVQAISEWAKAHKIDVVVWTDLDSNFSQTRKGPFSLDLALRHVQELNAEGKAKAAEYVWRAPTFVDTPLRRALQEQPWFPGPATEPAGAGGSHNRATPERPSR